MDSLSASPVIPAELEMSLCPLSAQMTHIDCSLC